MQALSKLHVLIDLVENACDCDHLQFEYRRLLGELG